MSLLINDDRVVLINGDSSAILPEFPPCTFDALVCDPPAGIEFMGKGWDDDKGGRDQWIAWLAGIMGNALRAMKPGAHGLVWALPRTSHWTATALEDAGFEVRDVVMHVFATGFPKSATSNSHDIPDGAGTALKPAVEHWILVRKPLENTIAGCFAEHGTGTLNIDACRVGDEHTTTLRAGHSGDHGVYGNDARVGEFEHSAPGRWPAHLVYSHHDECADACHRDCPVRLLDEQSGNKTGSNGRKGGKPTRIGYKADADGVTSDVLPSKGGASRFFFCAKPSKGETELGLDHLPKKTGGEATGREDGSAGVANPRAGAGRGGGRANFHPTKKSVALMRYLLRLVTPAGGLVLDPFAGSGTTGIAALAEGARFIGIEIGLEYIPIIEGRLRHALATIPAPGLLGGTWPPAGNNPPG